MKTLLYLLTFAVLLFCCSAVVASNLQFASNGSYSLVGLGYDSGYENAYIATASLQQSHFVVQRLLSESPMNGYKHHSLPLYYAITMNEQDYSYRIFTIDTRKFEILGNQSLALSYQRSENFFIDGIKADPIYKGQLLALKFKTNESIAKLSALSTREKSFKLSNLQGGNPFDITLIRIDPRTGKTTDLNTIKQVKQYYFNSGAIVQKSNSSSIFQYTFLIDKFSNIQEQTTRFTLVKITIPNFSQVEQVQLSGFDIANKYYLFMHYYNQTLYGFGTTIGKQTLFKVNVETGAMQVVNQLESKWNCDVLSFTVDYTLGIFAVELDVDLPDKMCFLDRQEEIQVMNFKGEVLNRVEYHNFPLVFASFGFL